jgi:uncharacterized Zn-finger protein
MESYPKFHNEVGVSIVRIGCREFKCIGDKPPQDHPHIYLNMAMLVRSAAPIALRYSVSIRAWGHTKLIRQIVRTVSWTKLKSSNAASLVMLPAANQRQAPSCRSLGAVHDGHERSEFGRMQGASWRCRFESGPCSQSPRGAAAVGGHDQLWPTEIGRAVCTTGEG